MNNRWRTGIILWWAFVIIVVAVVLIVMGGHAAQCAADGGEYVKTWTGWYTCVGDGQ
jgi:hypothetical protein